MERERSGEIAESDINTERNGRERAAKQTKSQGTCSSGGIGSEGGSRGSGEGGDETETENNTRHVPARSTQARDGLKER